MTLAELQRKSVLILGLGTEGQATYDFLRELWPSKQLVVADKRRMEEFPKSLVERLRNDAATWLHLGPAYLKSLTEGPEVIIKTPGIPVSIPEIVQARKNGCIITSHSQIFLSNYPRERIIGITGTKGKSTTASLLYEILKTGGRPAELVGNIGRPPLARLKEASSETLFVHEFSSHQLAEVESSPHIAVLLNIVPEHLDYYASFEEYAAAKANITAHQDSRDFLVFNSDYEVPSAIAQQTKAELRPFSTEKRLAVGCHLVGETIVWSEAGRDHEVMPIGEIPLAGKFNVQNVMAAAAAAFLCGVPASVIRKAVKSFKPLPHRLQPVGTYNGVTFYDDSIATVPEATLAALDALGPAVQTLMLGGHERNLDFSELAGKLPATVRTVILFPTTGERIWKAIELHSSGRILPEAIFVNNMEAAVRIAYSRTDAGKTCLLSPASPSFGMFKDYRERGLAFQSWVKKLGTRA